MYKSIGKINIFVIVIFFFGVLLGILAGISGMGIAINTLVENKIPISAPPPSPSSIPSSTSTETADWKIYNWKPLEFKYPSTWNIKDIYYITAAEEERGETPSAIGIELFPGKEPLGNDYIAIGGCQVSCEPPERHTKCSPIYPIANFIYTDSNNPEILKTFDKIISTFKFIEEPQK